MADKLEQLLQAERDWQADRPALQRNNADPMKLVRALQGEIEELKEALTVFEVTKTLEAFKDVCQEFADAQKFILATAIALNIDIFTEVMEKHAFNMLRYPASEFGEEADYDEVYPRMKAVAKREHMRETFYEGVKQPAIAMLGMNYLQGVDEITVYETG